MSHCSEYPLKLAGFYNQNEIKCDMFRAHWFDAIMSNECCKQCQTKCIEDCENVTFKQKDWHLVF